MRVSDFPGEGLLAGKLSSRTLGIALAFVSAAYGGLHLSAWNNFFPTSTEAIMWKVSAIVMVAGGTAAALVIVSEEFIYDPLQFI